MSQRLHVAGSRREFSGRAAAEVCCGKGRVSDKSLRAQLGGGVRHAAVFLSYVAVACWEQRHWSSVRQCPARDRFLSGVLAACLVAFSPSWPAVESGDRHAASLFSIEQHGVAWL